MAKVVVAKLSQDSRARAKKLRLPAKRVRNSEGKLENVYTIDVASPRFDLEFETVFQRAVNKARRDNKRLTGRTDFEPPRG